jgi:hypothetical protein
LLGLFSSYLLIGLDCLLDLTYLGHVKFEQMDAKATICESYFFAPTAIRELFEAQLVSIMMSLCEDKCIKLQIRI